MHAKYDQFTEPEEELLRPYDFIFFLLTRSSDPDTNCSKFCLHVMKSASDISGRLTKHLLMNSILRPNTPSPKTSPGSNNMFSQKSAEDLLRGLPVLNDRVLAVVSDLLQEEQQAHLIGILEHWLILCFKVVRLFKKKKWFIFKIFHIMIFGVYIMF